MRDNEKVQHPSCSLAPAFSGTRFLTLKSAGISDSEGPENITTLNESMLFSTTCIYFHFIVLKIFHFKGFFLFY
jgi:hypothetical protein